MRYVLLALMLVLFGTSVQAADRVPMPSLSGLFYDPAFDLVVGPGQDCTKGQTIARIGFSSGPGAKTYTGFAWFIPATGTIPSIIFLWEVPEDPDNNNATIYVDYNRDGWADSVTELKPVPQDWTICAVWKP